MVAALWSCPVQAAVRTSLIVKADPSADTLAGFRARFVSVQIHIFVFERAPETFNKHVVQPTASAVHGDADSIVQQACVKAKLVNWQPWSAVKIFDVPCFAKGSS